MGNCVFKPGTRLLSDEEDVLIRVVTPTGGVMELHPPITAAFITTEFPGHAIYSTTRSVRRSPPPLFHYEELWPGRLYYLLPMITAPVDDQTKKCPTTPYRMSFGHNARKTTSATAYRGGGGEVWKVRLMICPEELAKILAHDATTEELVESVRTVAKCGSYGRGCNSAANSDQWSVASSWKGYFGRSGHEDL